MKALDQKLVTAPVKISNLIWSTSALQILRTALELDLFSPLESGAKEASAVAAEQKLDARGVGYVLDALVALEMLSKKGKTYELNELSRNYLLPKSPLFLGPHVRRNEMIEKSWANLPEVIRTGKPQAQVNLDQQAMEFFPKLAENIFPLSYSYAQLVAAELNFAAASGAPRILDVAAGSGVWSIPLTEANAKSTVDVIDFGPILEVTKKFTARHKVGDRYKYIEGNWRDVEWEKEAYDVVILGHILHSEGPQLSELLLERCYVALKPGGHLVIAEMIANNERTAPPFPIIFAINMHLLTAEGCVFTEGELTELVRKCGFARSYRLPFNGEESPLMIAVK